MSAKLESLAAYHASMRETVVKQWYAVPQIPARINVSGKTALVTGSNCGLGFACSRQLLDLGLDRLIMGVRSEARGNAAAETLRAEFPSAKILVWVVDMSSYRSVQDFAAKCTSELDRLDMAMLNAGTGKYQLEYCEETKHEHTLQVNYLSTVLLGLLLLPKLRARTDPNRAADPGRLTVVVSDTALWSKMEVPKGQGLLQWLDDGGRKFEPLEQYGKTKLMLAMFAAELARHVSAQDVIVNAINPSLVLGTEVTRDMKFTWFGKLSWYLLGCLVGRKLEDGARIYLHALLVLGKESHGSFVDTIVRP